MIKSLILTALLTSGVGANATPLLNNKAETKETEQAITYKNNANTSGSQNEAQITWTSTTNVGGKTQQVFWTSETTNKMQNLYINRKYEQQILNDAVAVKAYMYENITCKRYEQGAITSLPATGWLMQTNIPKDPTSPNDNVNNTSINESTTMYAMQYQPYQNVIDNNLKLTFNTIIGGQMYSYPTTNMPENDYQFRTEFTFTLIASTNDYSSVIDMSLTQNRQQNYDNFDRILDPTGEFLYTKQIQTAQVNYTSTLAPNAGQYQIWTLNTSEDSVQVEFNVPIDPKKINYIITYRTAQTKLYMLNEQNIWVDATQYIQTSSSNYQLAFLGTTDNFIPTGYEAPIRSTAENLNTNEIKSAWHFDHGARYTLTGAYMPPLQTEVVDIPNLMFTVLGMPFTFISTAFNLTLFPGTPYQFNISSVFLMILGILIFIFVLRMILKVFK